MMSAATAILGIILGIGFCIFLEHFFGDKK